MKKACIGLKCNLSYIPKPISSIRLPFKTCHIFTLKHLLYCSWPEPLHQNFKKIPFFHSFFLSFWFHQHLQITFTLVSICSLAPLVVLRPCSRWRFLHLSCRRWADECVRRNTGPAPCHCKNNVQVTTNKQIRSFKKNTPQRWHHHQVFHIIHCVFKSF